MEENEPQLVSVLICYNPLNVTKTRILIYHYHYESYIIFRYKTVFTPLIACVFEKYQPCLRTQQHYLYYIHIFAMCTSTYVY